MCIQQGFSKVCLSNVQWLPQVGDCSKVKAAKALAKSNRTTADSNEGQSVLAKLNCTIANINERQSVCVKGFLTKCTCFSFAESLLAFNSSMSKRKCIADNSATVWDITGVYLVHQ